MTTLTEWLTLGRLVLYLAVVIVMAREVRVCILKAEPLNWLLWAAHGSIYCIVFLLDYQDKIFNAYVYNNWSALFSVHTIIVVIAIWYAKRTVRRGC